MTVRVLLIVFLLSCDDRGGRLLEELSTGRSSRA
jgi:hypothetical protein